MLNRRHFLAIIATPVAGCSHNSPRSLDVQEEIVSVVDWGGSPTAQPARPQNITNITIHHQGEVWNPTADVASYLVRLQQWSRHTKGWIDIPYHYIVGPDGKVYAARPWGISGDTNTEYDPHGHVLVMLLGNFEIQYPTTRQLHSTTNLLARIKKKFKLKLSDISAHIDYSTQTVCPGLHLYEKIPEIKAAIERSEI
jgi:hypothetical protein